jgi:hypothetical protein
MITFRYEKLNTLFIYHPKTKYIFDQIYFVFFISTDSIKIPKLL